jgi:glyoxylase-like metal-dependent hydrolase (beta-lactamase superfamily II)
MKEIGQGIYIENYYTGVTLGAIILLHGTILIDAPLRIEDARSWRAALVNLGSDANRLLVNLDAHPDRTLGARAMECTIIAHQKTAQIFRSRPSVFKGLNTESGSEWEIYNDAVGIRWAAPDITFTNHVKLHWGPPDITLEHRPGPAPGAIWAIVDQAKVIFVGDAVVANQPPFIANADMANWIQSLELLMRTYKDYTIVSGRGNTVTIEEIQAQLKTLKNVLRGLERLARRNATAEATDTLIPGLLSGFTFPAHLEEQYTHRLRYGLNQYYLRNYRQHVPSGHPRMPEEDA